jgi:hypothetical protein
MAIMLVLLMGGNYGLLLRNRLKWLTCTKFHGDLLRHLSNITVNSEKNLEDVMLILMIEEIYEACC